MVCLKSFCQPEVTLSIAHNVTGTRRTDRKKLILLVSIFRITRHIFTSKNSRTCLAQLLISLRPFFPVETATYHFSDTVFVLKYSLTTEQELRVSRIEIT